MSFVGSELLQAPCIPMWSSWMSLGARSPASEWIQRPEMHAHHAPGAWLPPSFGFFAQMLGVPTCPAYPAADRSHLSLHGRIKDLDWHQQRLSDILESREPGK
jgi:hypothetical protein